MMTFFPKITSSSLLLLIVTNLAIVSMTSATRKVCPQQLANDQLLRFCASNAFGRINVSRPEFENWNCNHPFNKYTQVSPGVCTPALTTPTTCTTTPCTETGPIVCARQASPDRRWPRAFTTAVFGNQCQLTQYNCQNPTRQFVAAPRQTGRAEDCTSIGL